MELTEFAMIALKIEKLGDVVSITLSAEALELLKAAPGDTLYLSGAQDGGLLSSAPPTLEERRQRGLAFLHRYRETFDALAK
jgi:hypothetical protein